MAKITIDKVRHSYLPEPEVGRRFRAEVGVARLGGRRRLRAARPLRLREDDAAQSHLRPAARRPRAASCSTTMT